MKLLSWIPVIACSVLTSSFGSDWTSWRGDAGGTGSSSESDLPTAWGPDENVKWRIDLPEAGNSTPVIFNDRVYLTQPVSENQTRNLWCLDRTTGKQLWETGLTYTAEERTHRANPYASASPAVDASGVYVSFGSAGFLAVGHDGDVLWERDFGAIDHTWGNSTSPVIVGDLVIHYHGPAKNAVLYALDKATGETIWEWKEPEWAPGKRTDGFSDREGEGVIGSFSTPILVQTDARPELIMSFPMELKAFDPATGEVLWSCAGLNPLVYTSPVHDNGIVVAMGGYHGNSIGVRVGGSGDVTESHRLWQEVRHNGGIGSGVALDGKLYYQDSGGVVYCDDMTTGKTLWKDRLPGAGKSWGSFVRSGDRIYTLSQAGDSVIFKASPEEFELIAQNELKEETNSSIAVSRGELFIRTHEGLWCVGE